MGMDSLLIFLKEATQTSLLDSFSRQVVEELEASNYDLIDQGFPFLNAIPLFLWKRGQFENYGGFHELGRSYNILKYRNTPFWLDKVERC